MTQSSFPRRPLLRASTAALLGGSAASLGAPGLARAQGAFPSRPVRMLIPVGVGGVTDIVGRIMAEAMQAALGQPVVPENLVGAGSRVGAAGFHRLPNDGYTVFIGTNNHPVMQAIDPNFAHHPINDFDPISLVAQQPFVLAVHPDVPANDLPSLLAWLRTQGERANFGTAAPGATNYMAGALFQQLSGASFTLVPYRTAAQAVADLLAGRMQLSIDSPTLMMPLIRDNRLRPIAVTSAEASSLVPNLPPISSALPGYALTAWQVLFLRPGAPADAKRLLTETAARVLRDPAVLEKLRAANVEPWPDSSPAAAARHVAREVEVWAPIAARIPR
jgi:tripartite-type tricarboxylate transporter receptor subunit TctC